MEGNINIFDRYGKLIISLDPSGPGWTGDYNGSKLPEQLQRSRERRLLPNLQSCLCLQSCGESEAI